ncbi:MAG: hypothetical protein AAF443_07555 [Chlamydiota bacterium]
MTNKNQKEPLLGDFQFELLQFHALDSLFAGFKNRAFLDAHPQEKSDRINRSLLDLINRHPNAFLLKAVVDYIARVQREDLLQNYTLTSFELWLNQFSGLSEQDLYRIRAKIAGKQVPRDAYQVYFPIGMGRRYFGTHFVTAHSSPDLDTIVASFWGWLDAFAAQVGDGLHVWNVPGGPPNNQVEIELLFKDVFGEAVFETLAKKRLSLTLTSLDLMTQLGMAKKKPQEPALSFDHERQRSAVVLVDDNGYYLGDWRTIDVEGVRQIVMSLNNCLMWLESNCHIQLISCFARKDLAVTQISKTIRAILQTELQACQPAKELPPKQLRFMHDYLIKVLQVEKGIAATFEEFTSVMDRLTAANFSQIFSWLKSLADSELFDTSGALTKDRPLIFNQLEILVKTLSEAFANIRRYVDRLEVAFKIKTDVFGFKPQSLSYRTDIQEVRSKIGSYSHLTVTSTDDSGNRIPLGVIHAADLQPSILGTVTLRDFCNREEMKIPSYLEIISVIDHHKSSLLTGAPPTALIADAQAASALVAKLAFSVNDQYSLGGMSEQSITDQLRAIEKNHATAQTIRIHQRLLQRKKVLQAKHAYWIDPKREFGEYLHFVYAILDDTDLLTKVSRFDVVCMAKLLNRLKSLILGHEVEIIHFDDIPEDDAFTSKAANRLLTNQDFYSLYSKVYRHKERSVEENLTLCSQGKSSNVFSDAKTINGCARVSQTKLFACNYANFSRLAVQLREIWHRQATTLYENNSDIVLHMHMVSTIASADELFQGKTPQYDHNDELWIWIPTSELAIGNLKLFLSAFKSSPRTQELNMNVEFLGPNAKDLSQVFSESFLPIPHHMPSLETAKQGLPLAILRYNAGMLNSRKGLIAPFIPRLDH